MVWWTKENQENFLRYTNSKCKIKPPVIQTAAEVLTTFGDICAKFHMNVTSELMKYFQVATESFVFCLSL
jgi:hypothetical protein